jgi:multidrug efflux pump subunit AcrB
MNLVQAALRRPFTVLVAIIAVLMGAWVSLQQMTRDFFPPLGIPTIYISAPYGGMDASQMEGFITYYYEYQMLYVTGVEHVESKSIQGAALLKLQLHPGTDMAQAMSEVVAGVNRARSVMPPGTVPPFVMRFDAGSVPVGNLVFSSATRPVSEVQDAALTLVRPLFATLPGVSAPPPLGGSARSIVVNLKPDRLRAYNLSPDDVVAAVSAANAVSPSGNVLLGGQYPSVPMNSVVKNIHDLDALPLRVDGSGAVYLRDVAEISDGTDVVTSRALVNGRRTVFIPVTKRADASTLAVVKEVKKNLPRFQSVLPDGETVSYEFDQSPYVTRAIAALMKEGVLGAVLTGLMVLVFLRDWRSAFIVVINIPLSLLAAVFALWASGQNINLMTLGGLALAVGILVDEATVTVENIHTHLARGRPVGLASSDATAETTLPRLLAMLCVLAVFIPAFFMVGAGRALFVPLSLAVGFAMIASYLLSSTLVPILSVWFLREHDKEVADSSVVAKLQQFYVRRIEAAMRWRWIVVASYVLAAGGLVWRVGPELGTEIFPKVDTGQLQVRFRAPAGQSLDRTEAVALQSLDIIQREVGSNNVAITLGFVGVHSATYPISFIHLWNGGTEEGILQVQLKRGTPVRIEELKERLREKFAAQLPQVEFSFEPGDLLSRVMSFGSPTPIEVAVSGPNLQANRAFAGKLRERLARIPALRDLQFGQALDYPSVDVNVSRERAGLLGVRITDATRSVLAATASSRFTTPIHWADPVSGVAYQLQVQIPQTGMDSLEDIQNIPVTSKEGRTVLLRNIATVTNGTAVGQYHRYNMQRTVTLTANVAGSDLGRVASQVKRAIQDAGEPPPKIGVAVRGQVEPMEQMLTGLKRGLLLAVAVIFLLLAANFQSLRLPCVVISTVPAVLAGVALALWLTGTSLNLQSFMGAIMAIGVAVANAILLVTFAERSRRAGATALLAAVEGARTRVRPILMTSGAMIAGMMPLALSLGEGGEQTAPLGRAVVGGLALATVATLTVLPAVFALVQSRAPMRSASLDPRDPGSSQFVPSTVETSIPSK